MAKTAAKTKKTAKVEEPVETTALATTESVDLHTGEIVDFDPASRMICPISLDVPEDDEIVYIPGMPLHIRANAKAGQFKVGEDGFRGREASMEIILVNLLQDVKLFNYPIQEWLQIFWIGEGNAVCHTLIKGAETLRNFRSLLLDLKIARVAPTHCIIKMKFEKREGTKRNADGTEEGTQYYVLTFSFEKNTPERIAQIEAFLASNDVFDSEIRQSLNNWLRGNN